jgi:photosystem II stability/assembly factor-like uncharacterized protein
VKRALLVLLLVVSCSHSSPKATAPSPSPTPSPTPSAATTATPSATPTVSLSPKPAAPVGPVGTKVPSGFVPQSATFISDTTGWVLGASPCPSGKGRCDVIVRTRDAGRTWKAIPSPRTSPETLAQIRFADATNGFVTGDHLWATHDGGATWRAVPGVDQPTEVAAARGRVHVVVASTLRVAPVSGGAFTGEASSVRTFRLHGAVVAVTTLDGGLVVDGRAVRTPCTEDDIAEVGLRTDRAWTLVCAGEAGLGHEDKTAYQTVNAGGTWQALPAPPPITGTDLYPTSDGTFLVDTHTVSVLRGGDWVTSLDSGAGISEGGFESAALGYAIGGFDDKDFVMKVSRDAGRTWKPVAF